MLRIIASPFSVRVIVRLVLPAAMVAWCLLAGTAQASAASVTLTASVTKVAPGGSVTLNATADATVSGTGRRIVIYQAGASTGKLKSCTTGSSCSIKTTTSGVAPWTYRAYIVDAANDTAQLPAASIAASEDRVVDVTPFTVTLTPAATTVATGATTQLTAKVNQALGGWYVLEIYNLDFPVSSIALCTTGTSCVGSISKAAATASRLQAVVRRYDDASRPALYPLAISAVATITPKPYVVTFTASPTVATPGQDITLTAQANQPLLPKSGIASYESSLLTISTSAGSLLASCTVVTCTAKIKQYKPGSTVYRAFVSSSSMVNGQAVETKSGQVEASVSLAPYSISLSTSNTVVATDKPATLTATANQIVGEGQSGTRMRIVDVDKGREVKYCSGGSVCTTPFNIVLRRTARLQAIVYQTTTSGDVTLASSNIVSINPTAFSMSIVDTASSLYTHDSYSAVVRFNQPAWTSDAYGSLGVYLTDLQTGETFNQGSCGVDGPQGTSLTCSIRIYPFRMAPLNYRVDVVQFDYQAQDFRTLVSSTDGFELEPFVTELEVGESIGFNERRATITMNHDPARVGGSMEIYDVTADRTAAGAGQCLSLTRCTTYVDEYATGGHVLVVVVRDEEGNIVSTSPPSVAPPGPGTPPGPGGPGDPDEITGGGNPSEDCDGQQCEGDPVMVTTGEFWLGMTDMVVDGRGPGLEFTRTYSAFRSAADGSLGHGWTHNYAMRIESAIPGVAVGNADQVAVVQENGSKVYFTRLGNGQYSAPPRVRGTLIRVSDGTFRFVRKAATTFEFDATGLLMAIRDRNGYATTMTRGTNRVLSKVTDTAGRTLVFTTDTLGRITSVTDPLQRKIGYGYDGRGDLRTVSPPTGGTARYAYDGMHRMRSLSDYSGNTTTNTYDLAGRVVLQVDPAGGELGLKYTADGRTIATRPGGAKVEYTIVDSMVRRELRYPGTDREQSRTFTYDSDTLGLTELQINGQSVKTMAYDERGNVTESRDGMQRETTTTWNAFDEPLVVTSPNGVVERNNYDSKGNLTVRRIEPADGTPAAETIYTYGVAKYPGDVTKVVDPEGGSTSNTWSANGFLTSTKDAVGRTTSAEYDALGRTVATVDGLGKKTSISYLDDGRRVRTVDPLRRISEVERDFDARVIRSAHPGGLVATVEYDQLGRPRVEKRNGQVRRTVEYFAHGGIRWERDAAGRETSYTYDAGEQVKTMTHPDTGVWTYTYDGRGRQTRVLDFKNRAVGMAYNGADEIERIDYSDPEMTDVSILRDSAGRPELVVDGSGSSTFTYDGFGRTKSTSDGAGSTVGYGYDRMDRVTSIQYPGTQGVVTNVYDKVGQVSSVRDWFNNVTSFTYDAAGNRLKTTYANGAVGTAAYNSSQQPTAVAYTRTGAVLPSFTTAFGATSGMLTQSASTNQPGAVAETYGYDATLKLTSVARPSATTALVYNPLDDLMQDETGGAISRNGSRQMTGYLKNSQPDSAFLYTDFGERASRTIGGVTTSYGYDQPGRLTGISRAGSDAVAYAYDWRGLRVEKTVGAVHQHMTWDVTSNRLPVLLSDGERKYLYGPDGDVIADSGTTAGSVRYLHADTLGSIRSVTDAAGKLIGSANYTAHGTPTTTGSLSRFGYRGEYTDEETGFVYLRARHYDPATGQFLTRDPIEAMTGDPYGYAGGNPVMNTDPSGLDWRENVAGFSAGFGDALSFGLLKGVRNDLGGGVNECSGWYTGGSMAGTGATMLTGQGYVNGLRGLRAGYVAGARAIPGAFAGDAAGAYAAREALKQGKRSQMGLAERGLVGGFNAVRGSRTLTYEQRIANYMGQGMSREAAEQQVIQRAGATNGTVNGLFGIQ